MKELLQKHHHLSDGTLGKWTGEQYDIELKPGAEPYHSKAYPVQHSQEVKLKAEVERLVQYKVLRKVNRSEWAIPSFTVVKRDGITLRSIADFRELNKRIKRKPFPIPKIQEMLLKLEGFQ